MPDIKAMVREVLRNEPDLQVLRHALPREESERTYEVIVYLTDDVFLARIAWDRGFWDVMVGRAGDARSTAMNLLEDVLAAMDAIGIVPIVPGDLKTDVRDILALLVRHRGALGAFYHVDEDSASRRRRLDAVVRERLRQTHHP